jgi:hypothetical protein
MPYTTLPKASTKVFLRSIMVYSVGTPPRSCNMFGDGVLRPRTNLYSITERSGTDPRCRHYQVDLIATIAIAGEPLRHTGSRQ